MEQNIVKSGLIEKIACTVVVLVLFGASVMAVPIVDGKYDPGEGYIAGPIPLNVEGAKKGDPLIPADPGLLGTYQDPGTGNVSVVFVQPVTLVDNTYGANAIGWPGGHKFDELRKSDMAEIVFKDGDGNVVLDVVVDYLYEDGVGYSTGVTAGEGAVNVGSAGDVLAVGTSLDYNLAAPPDGLGHSSFTTDSPLSVPDYSDPPSAPGWIFEVIYELEVDGSLFAANGFGGVGVTVVHDSPNKVGKNKVYSDGDLRIIKFDDEDQSGAQNGIEGLLEGWEFLVEGPNNFSQTVSTDATGTVTLGDLEPGEYTVTETEQGGWTVTTPNPVTVTVDDETLVTATFGNYEEEILGQLRIIKFEDEDRDGDLGPYEILLPDWEFLVEGPNSFSQTVQTEANGMVTLTDLELGAYTVTETLKSGWVITTPNPVSVTLPDETLVTVEFGNYEPDGNIPEPAVGSLLFLGLAAMKRRKRR